MLVIKWGPDEMSRQIAATRRQTGAGGEIYLSPAQSYRTMPVWPTSSVPPCPQPALVPASPWLDAAPPAMPKLMVMEDSRAALRLALGKGGPEPASLWVLQFRTNQVWTTEIMPAARTDWAFAKPAPEWVSISAVDRAGG